MNSMNSSGNIKISIFIAIGGATGTLFRYVLNYVEYYTAFPVWTIAENAIGSFLLAFLTGYVIVKRLPAYWQEGLGPGLCGSFTTMSTFAYDSVRLVDSYSIYIAASYMGASLFLGMLGALIGLNIGTYIARLNPKDVVPE